MDEAPIVAMLDDRTKTLHRASSEHLVTVCGQVMTETTVGPFVVVMPRAMRFCPDCYEVPAAPLPPVYSEAQPTEGSD